MLIKLSNLFVRGAHGKAGEIKYRPSFAAMFTILETFLATTLTKKSLSGKSLQKMQK